MLSSDILEQQFGETTVEILHQDSKSRIICTKVISTGQVLELSRVVFDPKGAAQFSKIHQTVKTGKSMGKAFKDAGVDFVRQTQSVSIQKLPPNFGKQFGSNKPATVVEVAIFVGTDKVPYARILETYSPFVGWPEPTTA